MQQCSDQPKLWVRRQDKSVQSPLMQRLIDILWMEARPDTPWTGITLSECSAHRVSLRPVPLNEFYKMPSPREGVDWMASTPSFLKYRPEVDFALSQACRSTLSMRLPRLMVHWLTGTPMGWRSSDKATVKTVGASLMSSSWSMTRTTPVSSLTMK